MNTPEQPKIYHIVHVDRLPSIITEGYLWCDERIIRSVPAGTPIGMSGIKQRRLNELTLNSHPDLLVGQCVPFYFCPRSVMLYVIHKANDSELSYRGGQAPIIHLESDLHSAVRWSDKNRLRWAFTLSNAGSDYFEDRCDITQLNELDWPAIQARQWQSCKEGKQAEFLVETRFSWALLECIGVYNEETQQQVINTLAKYRYNKNTHRPLIEVRPGWYY